MQRSTPEPVAITEAGHERSASPVSSRLPSWLPALVFAVAALCAVLPLIVNGCSCGHDFDFHLLSWMEAAAQWQHGVLKPVWAFTPAYNAGEPRLLFYPPLSWVTGAALGMVLPWPAVPAAYTALALFLSGLAMYRLLRRWVSPAVAVLGGCLYMVNPYMLFVAYERSAYAELMAAAWMPLLLAALLRERVTVGRVALPVALLWLTNAPSAVVGCYSVLFVGLLRLLLERRTTWSHRARFAATVTAGVLVALLADAFYLLPLALERRYLQLNLAVVPMARPDANFLFLRDNDAFHTHVLQQASWIAVGTAVTAVLCAVALLVWGGRTVRRFRSMHARSSDAAGGLSQQHAVVLLMTFTVVVFFLLTRWSAPFWHVGPELVFMQFPWRFLTIASAAAVALLALLAQRFADWPRAAALVIPAGVLAALLAGWFAGGRYFREECDATESVAAQHAQFVRGDGMDPTDEYTPVGADNGDLPLHLPSAYIAEDAADDPREDRSLTASHPHPETFAFTTAAKPDPALLMVRLRRFPGWHTMRDGVEVEPGTRSDGITVVPLPAGSAHAVTISYRTTAGEWAGLGMSGATVLGFAALRRRRRSGIMGPSA